MQYTPLSPSIPSSRGEGWKEPLETFHRMQYGVLLFILCGLFGHDGSYFGGSVGRYKFNVTFGEPLFSEFYRLGSVFKRFLCITLRRHRDGA